MLSLDPDNCPRRGHKCSKNALTRIMRLNTFKTVNFSLVDILRKYIKSGDMGCLEDSNLSKRPASQPLIIVAPQNSAQRLSTYL